MTSYRFTGPQGPSRKYGPNKGVMRELKVAKRKEAERRQEDYLAGNSANPYVAKNHEETDVLRTVDDSSY